MRSYLTIAALLVLPATALAEHPVHDGKWEITSSMTIPGMGAVPPSTMTQCITKKDPVPKHDASKGSCKVTGQNVTGSKVSWKVTCDSARGPTTGSGEITYSGDTFDGSMNMKMSSPRGDMEVTTTMKGKRVGECDAVK
jgi:hypothetical protein